MRVPVFALFGATGLGKTKVAVALAEKVGAEIVAADSMQVYRGLPVLTNQPTSDQLARVPFHLIGVLDPSVESSAAAYADMAHEAIDASLARGARVVVEGGSGLYLRAALGDLAFAGTPDVTVRRDLEDTWARDPAKLVGELLVRDPRTAARLDLANPRRVIRALEAVRTLGRPLAAGERGALWRHAERYEHSLIALEPRRDTLRERLDARVEAMIAAGALDEVRRARAAGPLSRTIMQAIGVRELCAVLDGELSLQEAAAAMRSRTHTLVRRQLTWLRKLPAALRVEVDDRDPTLVADDILARTGGA